METFTYAPRIEPTGSTEFAVNKAQFGDGYSQVVARGIQSTRQTWPLEFVGNQSVIRPIKEFFDRHGGYTAFAWTPPMSDDPATFLLQDGYKLTPLGAGNYRLTATFEQVFGR